MTGVDPHLEINHRFNHHPPKDEATVKAHEAARAGAKATAHEWMAKLPEGREKSLALTKLEEALFWANAAIALQGE